MTVAQPALAGELGRSAGEPAPAVRESTSDAEPTTRPPDGEGLPAAEAASGTAQVKAARPQAPVTSRLEPIEHRRERARVMSAEPPASREKTPAPDALFPGAREPQPARASEELELIMTARDALAARRHADARAAAERHARQFPSGVFGEEREAILALCACRETGARERARSFVERRPDSLFAERIREDCKLRSNLVPRETPTGTH
jgi:hypothetical protein